MPGIVITDIAWVAPNPEVAVPTTVQYRLTSDPDTPAYYNTVATNVLVNPDGHLPVPVTIDNLMAQTSYTVYMFSTCGGVGAKDIFITLLPTCPAGYTLSADGTYCYREVSVPADYIGGGSPYTICRNSSTSYNTAPMHIMKVDGYDTQGVPLSGSQYIPVSVATGTYWYNPFPATNTRGPLNRAGIWPCGPGGVPCDDDCPPLNTDVGFSRQFNVPTTKVYYIGVGADNYAKVTIQDSTGLRTLFEQNPTAIGNYFHDTGAPDQQVFASWLIYPVLLNAGPVILGTVGVNTGSAGVMGAEIYDNTEAELIAATQDSDLNFIFSTNPDLGFVSLGENFSAGNYSCAAYPDTSLVYDSGSNTYSCVKIETVPPNP
jgi:hypothetical protein